MAKAGLAAFADPTGYWERYDPIKDWMLDKRIDTLIAIMNDSLGTEQVTKDILEDLMRGGTKTAGFDKAVEMFGTSAKGSSSSIGLTENEVAALKSRIQASLDQMYKVGDRNLGALDEAIIMFKSQSEANYKALDDSVDGMMSGMLEAGEGIQTFVDSNIVPAGEAMDEALKN